MLVGPSSLNLQGIFMPIFNYSFTIDAPLEAVTAFHHSTDVLKKLTPPPAIVQLHELEPLGEGSISKFTLWFGPLSIPWTALHTNVGRGGFTDIQIEGPMRKWVHTHTFTAVNEQQTRIDEHIEYNHHSGRKGLLTRTLFAKPNLILMFSYRKWVTKRALNTGHPSQLL